jgi:hypothetical protein
MAEKLVLISNGGGRGSNGGKMIQNRDKNKLKWVGKMA